MEMLSDIKIPSLSGNRHSRCKSINHIPKVTRISAVYLTLERLLALLFPRSTTIYKHLDRGIFESAVTLQRGPHYIAMALPLERYIMIRAERQRAIMLEQQVCKQQILEQRTLCIDYTAQDWSSTSYIGDLAVLPRELRDMTFTYAYVSSGTLRIVLQKDSSRYMCVGDGMENVSAKLPVCPHDAATIHKS